MIDLDSLLALVRALNREGVEYAVVGTVALGLHGLARATEDLDLFVRPSLVSDVAMSNRSRNDYARGHWR